LITRLFFHCRFTTFYDQKHHICSNYSKVARYAYLPFISSPQLAKPKGTVSLPSVRPSVCHSGLFSAVDEDIQLKFDIWVDYISMNYRPRLRLSNFWLNYSPWCSHLVFRAFFFCPGWSEESGKFLYGFLFNSYISSSSFGTFDLFWLNYGTL
jgi:hypothetical protein